ncbi:MAG: 2-C-methyl-D-erythritol 4-phosphate cytidylyltransferase [Bacteroidales bacterium]|nr:2-C-methyl-D-erythritol 4-phosphate cytidylyltransferase [Bacteroidales bacterium]
MATTRAKELYVIVTAGGVGRRMGGNMAQQFLELEGKPVLLRTIEMLRNALPTVNVILTLPQEYKEYWRNYCFDNNLWFRHTVVSGGITRFHSVKNALEHVPQGAVVAVHDGVRPFVPKEMLHTLLNYDFAKEDVAGVIPVMPSIESMRMWTYGQDGMPDGSKTVNRDEYMFVQTPQVFDSTILKECYKKPYSPEFTDDASVVESCGYKVATAPGSRFNIKLTTPEDLVMARIFLSIMEEK